MSDPKKPQNKLNIELPEDVASGIYSNLAVINHSPTEFVLDFVSVMPGVPKAKVKSRIILTPQHAKRLIKALSENVRRYESNFGEIKENEDHHGGIPMNFGPPGEA
jgi:hypothetical protein